MAGTIQSWLGCALAILPATLDKTTVNRLFTGIAAYRPSRPSPQPRGQRDAGDRLMQMLSPRMGTNIWIAAAIMVRSGQRAREAVRIASGHIVSGTLGLSDTLLRGAPLYEKGDRHQKWVRPPITLPLEAGESRMIHKHWNQTPLSSAETSALFTALSRLVRSAGYTDLRTPRRDLAESVALNHGDKAAGLAIRHKPNSPHTIRYTGGLPAALRMEHTLRSSTPQKALNQEHLLSEKPCVSPTPRAPLVGSDLIIPATMAGGRLSALAISARQRAAERLQFSLNEAATRRMLGM